ncbi:Kinesin, putative [Hondaea fermentalgiana]|uniref:Kinesin-like protein n=1 Tax=Hondaea fermentalgiana TaxID=2315210 RepID=A0A2R5G4J1_9STRA|nr:Kinesin, putative [Hondaea fermentalgiana]|eukprot:GBG25229.1 Kinesin, putative [Hondaea fermentalgiana]
MSYYTPGVGSISRPKTYDPELARRAKEEHEQQMDLHDLADRIAENQRKSLRQELGFDDDDDDAEGSIGDDLAGHTHANIVESDFEHESKSSRDDNQIREELHQLQQRYLGALRELHQTGEKERRASEQVAILKRMSKTQVAILKRGFQEKIGKHHALAQEIVNALDECEQRLKLPQPVSTGYRSALQTEKIAAENLVAADPADASADVPVEPASADRITALQRQLESLKAENKVLRQSFEDLSPGFIHARPSAGASDDGAPMTPCQTPSGARKTIDDKGEGSALSGPSAASAQSTPVLALSSKLNNLSVEALRVKLVKALKVAKSAQNKLAAAEKEKTDMLALLGEARAELERRRQDPSGAPSTPKNAPHLRQTQDPQTPPTPAVTGSKGEKIKEKFESLKQKVAVRDAEVAEAKQTLSTREQELQEARAIITELSAELDRIRTVASQGAKRSEQAQADQQRRSANRRRAIMAGLDRVRHELRAMNEEKSALSQSVRATTQATNAEMASLIKQLSERVAAKEASMSGIVTKYQREYRERRRLFNLVQELRGNIRVLCRVRPALDFEENDVVVRFPQDGAVELRNAKGREKSWEFDHVFKSDADNAKVFEQVSDLCTSILDGYNVCIFAYGQTGSGKTHTMEGPEHDRGVNFRALDRLFANMRERNHGGEWEFEVQVTLLEIYNEQIRDLLADKAKQQQQKKLEVKAGKHGMHVPGLTMVTVTDHTQVLRLMKLGKKNRSVACTDMNSHSSRSHSMLSTYVLARNTLTGEEARGKLHLIDLAGSERVSKSGVQGARLTEATNINKSLSALGDVIQARANKQGHVPFRNSTLTYLLQDSLSQDSKTLMFVQVSPVKTNAEESFCSLNFAARARTVELGKASKHTSKTG